MTTNTKDVYLQCLVNGVNDALSRFDEDTGRFMSGTGWAVTNQDIIYPLALLYKQPGNPCHEDERILDHAMRGGDALRNFQYPDGRVEFVKVDGSKWGPTYMPWSMYHWLETYILLRDELPNQRKQNWEDGLALAFDGIAKQTRSAGVHNIPTWNGMSLYRAGKTFDNHEWLEVGSGMIYKTVSEQQAGGYWLEHGGPTTSYNYVYVHAIGLYHEFSGDEGVIEALRKATQFHLNFTYPDGVPVETIDGRVKYRGTASDMAHAAFSLFPEGRRYVKKLLLGENPTRFGLSPRIASAFTYWREGEESEIPQEKQTYFATIADAGREPPNIALIRKHGDWFVCLSGIVTPSVESRWGQDRQQFLSIWHKGCGLIVGGGNSKHQPEWSNFVVEDVYIPTEASLSQTENSDKLSLRYGEAECDITVAPDGDGLLLEMNSSKSAEAHVMLHLTPGETLKSPDNTVVLGEEPIRWDSEQLGDWIQHRGFTIQLPEGCSLSWPSLPFNPYAKDGKAAINTAVGIIAVNVMSEQGKRFRFSA